MALRLQQALVDVPISNLKTGESIRSFLTTVAARLGLASPELQQQFYELLSQVFASDLGFWICDYVAVVCGDDAISSSDPEEHALLQPTGVLGWCQSAAHELQNKVVTLVKSGATTAAQPDHIIEVGHAAKTLLAIAEAVRAAMGASPAVVDLISTLQLLRQTTQVLQWLEQLQQQRPGLPPLIARTVSSRPLNSGLPGIPAALNPPAAGPIEPFGPRAAPAYVSLPAWQQKLTQRRQATPGGKLFLDDLVDNLLKVSAGQRAVAYPYSDVLSCVEGLFMTGSSSSESWKAKLALLLYYLLDGGWLTIAAPFAQGFQLSLTMVQQWRCHYLMDNAAAADDNSNSGNSAAAATAGGSSKLDEACKLLGATASPTTPFRFVEALLAAGRPLTALAVQRARCTVGSAAGAAAAGGLAEARVLLKVQLGCGLLAEAFSELRRHCSQLPYPERLTQVTALIQQLASWAAEPPNKQQQQQQGLSRLQLLCQLPFNAEEESALLNHLRQKMDEGESVGHVVPLYLLQRGRSLEALKAYSDYQASPAAASAASRDNGAVLQRQLQTLMAAAAAALPPSLRATAVAAVPGSSSGTGVSVLAGLGGSDADISKSAIPVVVLQRRGVEQPVFMTQLVPAAAAGAGGISEAVLTGVAAAAGDAADTAAVFSTFWKGFSNTPAAAAAPPGISAENGGFAGSLFRAEVEAAAGPGAVAIGRNNQGLAGAPTAAADGDYVPLLFGTPAPNPAAAKTGFGVDHAGAAGFNTPGGADVAGFSTPGGEQSAGIRMSEEQFSREVLGIHDANAVEKGATGGAGTRSIKRQRQTPGGYRPGAK